MSPRGGARPGAGRPADVNARRHQRQTRLSDAELAELTAGLRDDETISDVLREGGLRLVRSRKP